MARITVTTANVCGNPLRSRPAVRSRAIQALKHPGAVFGQEIAASNRWRSGNYSKVWVHQAALHGKETFGQPHEVPISVPNNDRWDVQSGTSLFVHAGKKAVSPNRYITVVKAVVAGRPVALINCHTVSKPRLGVPFGRWRIRMWNVYHQRLVQEVALLVEQGYTVVFGGDMNKKIVPTVHPAQRTLIESGLDHLWVVPGANTKFKFVRKNVIKRTTIMDHPILTVVFDI